MTTSVRNNIGLAQGILNLLNADPQGDLQVPSQRISVLNEDRSAFLQKIDDEYGKHVYLDAYQCVLIDACQSDIRYLEQTRKSYVDKCKMIGLVAGSALGFFVSVFLPAVKEASTLIQFLYRGIPIWIGNYTGYNFGESLGKVVVRCRAPSVNRVITDIWLNEMIWIKEQLVQANTSLQHNQFKLRNKSSRDETRQIEREIEQINQFIGYYIKVLEHAPKIDMDYIAIFFCTKKTYVLMSTLFSMVTT